MSAEEKSASGRSLVDMNKIFLGFLCAILVAGALSWNWKQAAIINEQQKKIDDLVSKTSANPTADIDLQEKCASQAKRAFEQSGYQNNEMAGYFNHYNHKLGKCFVETQSTDAKTTPGTIWTYKVLSDAYEGKIYGTYSWHTVENKKYWEVPPFDCSMYPDGNDSSLKICKSDAEFDNFGSTFLEN
jgi:hypothetical protein